MEKTALITGSTSGIGKATAKALAQSGWQIIIHGRKKEACLETMEELTSITKNSKINYITADLSELSQVKLLAQQIKEEFPAINILINNAGTFSHQRILTAEGLERTWVVNYLSRFLLINELRDLLEKNGPSRIIDLSGAYHKKGQIHFEDISLAKNYSLYRANNQSKLANVLHTFYLAKRVLPPSVTVNTLHPGAVNTGAILKSPGFSAIAKWTYRQMSPIMKTADQGADTPIFLAKANNIKGVTGQYFVNNKIAQSGRITQNIELQERLWQLSHDMVNESILTKKSDN
jgi:NAD(P)-dependent dehydrogenase (short-subunit alcohol dehydrogenase family)